MKPYAILLGGTHPKALVELHDICFVMAESHTEAFKAVADRWFGDLASAHVDAWMDLSHIDGHELTTGQGAAAKHLFFVNVGSYEKDVFSENHQYFFLICKNKEEAKKRALGLVGKKSLKAHKDNLSAVDSLIKIDQIENHTLRWKLSKKASPSLIKTGYWPLKKFR